MLIFCWLLKNPNLFVFMQWWEGKMEWTYPHRKRGRLPTAPHWPEISHSSNINNNNNNTIAASLPENQSGKVTRNLCESNCQEVVVRLSEGGFKQLWIGLSIRFTISVDSLKNLKCQNLFPGRMQTGLYENSTLVKAVVRVFGRASVKADLQCFFWTVFYVTYKNASKTTCAITG